MKTTLIVALALMAAGCGGGDDDADNATDAAVGADEPSGEAGADTEASADTATDTDGGDGSGGPNTATVVVGDETFDFEWEPGALTRCDTDFFGGFWALASNADGGGLEAEIWPDDAADPTQVTKIEVSGSSDGTDWTADPDETIGESVADWPAQVDSFEIDGNTVTGSATFVGDFVLGSEPEGVPGTFEITCNE